MNKEKLFNIIEMIVLIITGLIILVYPGHSITIADYILGGALILYGVFNIVQFILGERKSISLIAGIIAAAAGIFALAQPDKLAAIFPIFVGLVLVFSGMRDLINAIRMRHYTKNLWKFALALAFITIAVGVILVINPFKDIETVVIIIGIALIYDGIVGLVLAIKGENPEGEKTEAKQ